MCDPSDLSDLGFDYTKEGLPRAQESAGDCQDIDAIYTNEALVTGASFVDLYEIEDYSVESAADTSLCSALQGQLIEDGCDDCIGVPTVVAASVTDYCLKQLWTAYAREICENPYEVGSMVK